MGNTQWILHHFILLFYNRKIQHVYPLRATTAFRITVQPIFHKFLQQGSLLFRSLFPKPIYLKYYEIIIVFKRTHAGHCACQFLFNSLYELTPNLFFWYLCTQHIATQRLKPNSYTNSSLLLSPPKKQTKKKLINVASLTDQLTSLIDFLLSNYQPGVYSPRTLVSSRVLTQYTF